MKLIVQLSALTISRILATIISGIAIMLAVVINITTGFSQSAEQKTPAPTFITANGKFSIALPQQPNGLGPTSSETVLGNVNGVGYFWRINEGDFQITFLDSAQVWDDAANSNKVIESIHSSISSLVRKDNGKLVNERQLNVENYPGLEFKLEFPDLTQYRRYYLISHRFYELSFILRKEQRVNEAFALKVFDSFKLLSDSEVIAAAKAKAAQDEPAPLPQQPFVPRVRSDAEDDGLHGRVKTVYQESETQSKESSTRIRQPTSRGYYNERGYLTRTEVFEAGYLFEIAVFGYLDGSRVDRSKVVHDESDPTPMGFAAAPGMKKPDPLSYQKLTFRYDNDKRLVEEARFSTGGQLWTRVVYKYIGNPASQCERLTYKADGSLNWHVLSIFDDKGNEIERTSFERRDGSVLSKYVYTYEFDEKGNWIKRTSSRWVTKEGKSFYTPSTVNYRIITYY